MILDGSDKIFFKGHRFCGFKAILTISMLTVTICHRLAVFFIHFPFKSKKVAAPGAKQQTFLTC